MNAVAELVEDTSFFAPVPSDLIDGLISQYDAMRAKIERVADVLDGPDMAGALHYFGAYAASQDTHVSASIVDTMFDRAGALAHLDAAYWSKAMHLTDVLDVMPQARRDEWNAQILNPLGKRKIGTKNDWEIEPIPAFTDENVRGTLQALLTQRETFFAERVDGIFRVLSQAHVTNTPEGFRKRMIIAGMFNGWGSADYSRAGYVNDLRCVIARFMGRDEPKFGATNNVLRYARDMKRGEWVTLDGGAIRIRCYGIGTAHLEVHPDMAWRLNCVLARLYPMAIPSKFRERPKKKAREHRLIARPLPFATLEILATLCDAADVNPKRGYRENLFVKVPGCYDTKGRSDEADTVLEAIGGAKASQCRWAFDYDPRDVVAEIVASGCIPDAKSHQYYPTPKALAERVIELAEIGPNDTCLEPSAGTGGLADFMPRDRTKCIEISKLHCDVLRAKGFASVWQVDFLELTSGVPYGRVVMNPPFSEGRWQAHLEHAAQFVAPGGRLVAILPSGAKTRTELPGFRLQWHGPLANQFPGVSVDVVILVADRA